ncbi:aryl-alcohol dehydrogenase-like predicted oxidoreductase [Actinoalloteichus hoggarensis]|uniref:General stress protein 69 n=1 Tax=Actinoalloteichus hoggarensis TaxID=1470176 RepID=A0A221W733_9PSEU|nr:aldo/keto reductase [Actinoalloteichus hoggarensis]ASO21752.1 General stress protein 69 [Actinoalloteichus hoggarensis]MBB5922349.1 aryl-alcohol dehydrogenase-like predicted oxidoreductase [Actinoalloteichus hoggarensis]
MNADSSTPTVPVAGSPAHRRALGRSGLEVTALGLGCMGMSWVYDESSRDDAESVRVIQAAVDNGVTLIDTADLYGPFTNEVLVGKALRGRRDEVTLATKCGLVPDMTLYPRTVKVTPNGTPEHIRASIDGSLSRLGVDHVDLYQLHRVDPEVPIEESWGAMAELQAEGKAVHIGLSEAGVADLERAAAVAPIATLQSELSLWSRDTLAEVLPWCTAHGVGFIAFSPLGRGFLAGAVRETSTLSDTDFRAAMPRFQDGALQQNLRILAGVEAVAKRHDAAPSQVALAWVLAQDPGLVAIPGCTVVGHLTENLGALGIELTPGDLAELDGLPAPVGTRF